ncbi:VOC family protein [Paracidobacterium acidisoli]|uniref:VOC family protein n=1 Tax=Paracidobacterium acidisoli TaxID=2303751 RepID=A0A372IR17_9BACT|nr:VOC family protein [Paracidobacterium acidisoli]MBT9331299.1 VOC family protein [Paracidobacterium acidisoli]
MQKISPFLWFDRQAEEAVDFYTSIFQSSKKGRVTRYGDAFPDRSGEVMTVGFELFGQEFTALNGGPHFTFTPAVSFFIRCDSQDEVDFLWEKLSEGGRPGQCGWLTDKFGVSWQVVPVELFDLLADKDSQRTLRVTQAMLAMKKFDINALRQA